MGFDIIEINLVNILMNVHRNVCMNIHIDFYIKCQTRFSYKMFVFILHLSVDYTIPGGWPAWTHGFNAKIGFKKYAPSPEISAKMSKILQIWFGDLNLDTFNLISQDSVHIFQNRFLHWNRGFEPVVLSTMNPRNLTKIFLSYKGSFRILERKSTQLKFWKFYFFQLILVLCI